MTGLKNIKKRIKSVSSTYKLTSAMKLLAASKLQHLMASLMIARDYEKTLQVALLWALQDLTLEEFEICKQQLPWYFAQPDVSKPHIILVFGANKGLCGNYNLLSIREALEVAKTYQSQSYVFIPLTLKTTEYFQKHHKDHTEPLPGLGHFEQHTNYIDLAHHVLEHIFNRFKNNGVGSVSLIRGKFVNALIQRVDRFDVFPIFPKITPENISAKNEKLDAPAPLIEPSKIKILEESARHFTLLKLYLSFLESETCEQAARVTMMESAKHNAEDLIDTLTLQYNRTRQANITNELIEIIAGTSAMRSE